MSRVVVEMLAADKASLALAKVTSAVTEVASR